MVNVAVVGDLMLDKSEYYRTGERENPENPLVPLVKKSTLKEEYSLGGAGNLAANIQSMIGNVLLLGPFNPKMPLSQLIMDISHANNLRFQGIQTSAPVIVKTRQYINNQPKLRIDEGDDDPIVIASEEKQRIVNILLHGQPSHIIISDYAK
ncbi:hypothetical protein KBC03_04710 [Patescibacteria group bacterium]|nr:hypothetical protein [Patescibacteria group bacterium]